MSLSVVLKQLVIVSVSLSALPACGSPAQTFPLRPAMRVAAIPEFQVSDE